MYSLTFRVRVTTSRSMDEMERHRCRERRARSMLVDFIAGEGVFAGMRSACGVRWAWRITAGLCHALLVFP